MTTFNVFFITFAQNLITFNYESYREYKKIRIQKGISHDAMAINLDISQAAYTKIEKNETKLTIDRLYKIAEILETNVADLLRIEVQKIYQQEFKDNSDNYQEFQNLYQKNEEIYEKLIQSKDEQITLLKETIL